MVRAMRIGGVCEVEYSVDEWEGDHERREVVAERRVRSRRGGAREEEEGGVVRK